jgi:tricorn protease
LYIPNTNLRYKLSSMKPGFLIIALLIPFAALAQSQEAYFSAFPCLSPDGKTIVFSYEGDLWRVSSNGGQALRLTAMAGEETRAKYSPDGNWIAFTGAQFGNDDVFVMPSSGGDIKQLTFHDNFDQVDNWSWDNKTIYFTSGRMGRYSAYKINREGGSPVRLFDNYFNTVHDVTERPNGELFFNETFESKNQAYRKGYKGAYNPDIQSWNASTKEFKKYTDYNGKDMWPTIDKQGNIYFVSDEGNGQYNLYTFTDNAKTALTNFPVSIHYPVVNAEGGIIVFEKDYQVYKYDVTTKTTTKVPIHVVSNRVTEKEKDFNVKDEISYFDVSLDGKKMAFVSRGELFASDIKGKYVQHIQTNSLGRVMEVKWMADNKILLFSQTSLNGFTNWYTVAADGIVPEKPITTDAQNNRELTLNSDRTKGVYLSGRNEVRVMDLKTMQSKTVVRDELWGFQNSTPYISPNNEYVLFTAKRNFEEDIFLYNLQNEKLTNLTHTGVTEASPYWSPDGKYIYFTTDRLKPMYPFGPEDAHVYRVALEKFNDDFKSDNYSKLFTEKIAEEKKEDQGKSKNKKAEPKTETPPIKNYTIDLDHILDRVELVSPDFGQQRDAAVFQKDEKTWVIYSSNHGEGKFNLWLTTYEPFEKAKSEKMEGAATGGALMVNVSDKYYALINGNISTLNLETKKAEKIDINVNFRRNMRDEFNQMFMETWANLKENFYNETFHGINWEEMRDSYATFLPYIQSRDNLRILLRDLLGELNSSHTGFTSQGDEEKTFYDYKTLATGMLFNKENPYQVVHIIPSTPMDRKGISVQPGDLLVAVNGENVNTTLNRESYFSKPTIDPELSMTFKRGTSNFTVKIAPESSRDMSDQAYDEWIANNQKVVDEKGKQRIAYAYMKNMGNEELEKFLIDMSSEAYHRDALILDLRYNTGGNVHDKVIQFLSQRPYLQWRYREGELTQQPNFTPASKPIVLLVNEQSLSDAEMTAAGFKQLGLGKIIGTETYRWIIFTSGKGLVDGSFYRLPAWGCYTLDGKNIEKEGVKPDIFVPMTFKDRVEGNDPQLDRAIEEILKALR